MKSDLEIAEFWYKELIEGLRSMASTFEVQKNSLPDFVHLPDEVMNALPVDSFESLRKQGLLSLEEHENVKSFDENLDQMEIPDEYEELLEEMRTGQQFQTLRIEAKCLLEALGHKYREPKVNAIYVQSS